VPIERNFIVEHQLSFMRDQFENLIKAEKFFLDKTKESLDSDFKAAALDVAANLDEFRCPTRDIFRSNIKSILR